MVPACLPFSAISRPRQTGMHLIIIRFCMAAYLEREGLFSGMDLWFAYSLPSPPPPPLSQWWPRVGQASSPWGFPLTPWPPPHRIWFASDSSGWSGWLVEWSGMRGLNWSGFGPGQQEWVAWPHPLASWSQARDLKQWQEWEGLAHGFYLKFKKKHHLSLSICIVLFQKHLLCVLFIPLACSPDDLFMPPLVCPPHCIPGRFPIICVLLLIQIWKFRKWNNISLMKWW